MNRKVLVTSRSFGKLSDEPKNLLEQAGFCVDLMGTDFDMERFTEALPEYDALIIGAHDLPPELLDKCTKLKIIAKHGVGLDNIPLKEAAKHGITVTNTPGANSQAVADLAFGLMLNAARKISLSADHVRNGVHKQTVGVDVYGKTLGILGFGRIGQAVAQRARGFSMKVLAYDPFIPKAPEELSFVKMTDIDTILRNCDFVSLHLPLTEETRNSIGKEQFEIMKQDAVFINTSRGGVVDEDALYEALANGKLLGAGLDVTKEEPTKSDNRLLGLENVVITDHIGMYSREAASAVSMMCSRAICDLFAGKTPKNVVRI